MYQFPEPINRILESMENSGFSVWVREANTPFAYPSVLALHTFGLILLVGFSSALAMRRPTRFRPSRSTVQAFQ